MKSVLRTTAILFGAAVAAAGSTAWGQGRATNTVPVRLRVESSCSLATNPLMFGTVTSQAKSVRATTTIALTCPPGTMYSIAIDNGKYWDGTTRRMYGGQANGQVWYADYKLYRDTLYSLPWTSGVTGSAMGTVPSTGKQTLTIYGEAALKNVRSSGYLDTVTVTVDF